MKSILKHIMRKNKRGQLGIGDAPGVVLIVLFLFMCMGTAAFVLDKYGDAFGADESVTVNNETLASVDEIGEYVTNAGVCNFESFAVSIATNATDGKIIASGNYSTNANTGFINVTAGGASSFFNGTDWNLTYTYNWGGTACNIAEDLTEEVEENTSIAGMILTIALIGIVLSILIGLFYVFTGKGGGGGM